MEWRGKGSDSQQPVDWEGVWNPTSPASQTPYLVPVVAGSVIPGTSAALLLLVQAYYQTIVWDVWGSSWTQEPPTLRGWGVIDHCPSLLSLENNSWCLQTRGSPASVWDQTMAHSANPPRLMFLAPPFEGPLTLIPGFLMLLTKTVPTSNPCLIFCFQWVPN